MIPVCPCAPSGDPDTVSDSVIGGRACDRSRAAIAVTKVSAYATPYTAAISLLGRIVRAALKKAYVYLTAKRRMDFFEELPDQCPPAKAIEPNGAYFRLIQETPIEEDFHSHKLLGKWPKSFANASECEASSLSLMDSFEEAHRLTKLPNNKGKKILRIDLVPKDGLLMQTGRNLSHHSWWRSGAFCIRESSKQLVDE